MIRQSSYTLKDKIGFKEAKRHALEALEMGVFQHEVRNQIDEKNLLHAGDVTTEEVINIIERCNGRHHTENSHHTIAAVTVHVLKRDGWYIKFYFVGTDLFFLSVHK